MRPLLAVRYRISNHLVCKRKYVLSPNARILRNASSGTSTVATNKIDSNAHTTIDSSPPPDDNWRAFRTLAKYVWPTDSSAESRYVKQRVVASLGLVVGSKAVTIQIPFVFKALVDTIPDPTGHLPIILLAGYGLSRSSAAALQEFRNIVFARVTQNAIRTVGRQTFDHVHSLDLQFHLSRNTGQLARVLDRGQRSISFVLNAMVFNVGPTLLEVSLVTGLIGYQFGMPHASVVLGTVGAYTGFTFVVTSW